MTHTKYQHSLDKTGECAESGFSAEQKFKELAEQRGYEVKISGREQQFNHVDFILKKDNKEWKVDVKGAKKISRQNNDVCFQHIWLEWKNCRGNDGWLTTEKGCDTIAFELENEFVIVSRKDLLKLAKKLCNLEKMVGQSKNALYCGYKRFGRRDLLSIIKTEDLLTIKHSKWLKT